MKKTYTKKQITEAIAYWKKQLKTGNYKKMNESNDDEHVYVYVSTYTPEPYAGDDSWIWYMDSYDDICKAKYWIGGQESDKPGKLRYKGQEATFGDQSSMKALLAKIKYDYDIHKRPITAEYEYIQDGEDFGGDVEIDFNPELNHPDTYENRDSWIFVDKDGNW